MDIVFVLTNSFELQVKEISTPWNSPVQLRGRRGVRGGAGEVLRGVFKWIKKQREEGESFKILHLILYLQKDRQKINSKSIQLFRNIMLIHL